MAENHVHQCYDADGNPIPRPVYNNEEEEEEEAVEDMGILNTTQTSQSSLVPMVVFLFITGGIRCVRIQIYTLPHEMQSLPFFFLRFTAI